MSQSTAGQLLKRLVAGGFLYREGGSKNTRYLITDMRDK
jgi:DNA-binding MarR family transcriptional regulator